MSLFLMEIFRIKNDKIHDFFCGKSPYIFIQSHLNLFMSAGVEKLKTADIMSQ